MTLSEERLREILAEELAKGGFNLFGNDSAGIICKLPLQNGHNAELIVNAKPDLRWCVDEIKARQSVIEAARVYANARQACPIGDWNDRIEQAGWELAQAVRAFDKLPSSPSPLPAEGA